MIPNRLAVSVSSPEKAGVGGSIPSLATLFSGSYRPPLPLFCSILFQFPTQGLPVFVSKRTGWGERPFLLGSLYDNATYRQQRKPAGSTDCGFPTGLQVDAIERQT
jgi:hypothetical protein